MDLSIDSNHCALCGELLKSFEFNLNSTKCKRSKTLLLPIIETVTGKINSVHYNICLQCFNLINELDSINIRQKEIRDHFRKYLENSELFVTEVGKSEQLATKVANVVKSEQLVTEVADSIKTNITDGTITNEISDSVFDFNGTGKYSLNSDIEVRVFFKTNLNGRELDGRSSTDENQSSTDVETDKIISKKKGNNKKYFDVPKLHKCHCSKEFRTKAEFKNHMITHNPRQFICEICGQSYKHKSAFNVHMGMHNGINPFTCVYCNKSFTQKGALVRHVPIHTGEKPYQCDECGKRFIHHTSFNVHRMSHTGLKSYKCTYCGLGLISGSHLKRHMRIHTGEKKYACDTCGKRFAERYNLAVHEKLHSNPGSSTLKGRYSCQICDAVFERKTKVEEHLIKEHQTMLDMPEKKNFVKPFVADVEAAAL